MNTLHITEITGYFCLPDLKYINPKLVLKPVTRVCGAEVGTQGAHALHDFAKVYMDIWDVNAKLCSIFRLQPQSFAERTCAECRFRVNV